MYQTSLKTTHLEHGVFVVIYDIGVLIRGPAGIGKSSLALELIDRGHGFVSDDAVQFSTRPATSQSKPAVLIGSAPSMLQNLLAVRDIGVLDISKFYASKTIITEHSLGFIIQLTAETTAPSPNITNPSTECLFLGHKFPIQSIFAHESRNLALIVETALKNYILCQSGLDAGHTLITRQQLYL